MTKEQEDVYKRLRKTSLEFGQENLDGAIVIGPNLNINQIGGHQYLIAPTLGSPVLSNVDFKVARFFEDI